VIAIDAWPLFAMPEEPGGEHKPEFEAGPPTGLAMKLYSRSWKSRKPNTSSCESLLAQHGRGPHKYRFLKWNLWLLRRKLMIRIGRLRPILRSSGGGSKQIRNCDRSYDPMIVYPR